MAKQQETQRVMVTLTASQLARLDATCAETGASRSQTIAIALYEWLARIDQTDAHHYTQ